MYQTSHPTPLSVSPAQIIYKFKLTNKQEDIHTTKKPLICYNYPLINISQYNPHHQNHINNNKTYEKKTIEYQQYNYVFKHNHQESIPPNLYMSIPKTYIQYIHIDFKNI